MLHRNQLHSQWKWISLIVVFLLIVGGVLGVAGFVMAKSEGHNRSETAVSSPPSPSNQQRLRTQLDGFNQTNANVYSDETCRLCHGDTERVITFESGETIAARVDTAVLAHSAHGDSADEPLNCTGCHDVNAYQYPHDLLETADYRSYQLAQAGTCERCHVDPHLTSHPGPDSDSPVGCTDCHGNHDVLTVDQLRTGEGTSNCIACHTAAEVPFTNGSQLTDMIQHGLFAGRYETTAYCLACHTQPDLTLTFENGDTLSLTIDENAFHDSVHGDHNENGPLECLNCHEGTSFPHDPITATSNRAYNLERYPVCNNCHETKYASALDDSHGRALAEGNENAAICTDCHSTHDTPTPNVPRERISHTCEQCHSTIFAEYAESVHGDALLSESNPDVPTCIECHSVHNITEPTTALFRVRSPELCAGCHADENLMTEYEISTEVFDTYVADFHGTTVTLFEHDDPNVETNKAVCYDCHGVHNIKRPDDPQAGIRANLLETCQQCHPDANEKFPASWTSHFRPSLEHNPLVYLVNLFYQIVIPLTVGFFALLVLTDIYRRVRMRIRK